MENYRANLMVCGGNGCTAGGGLKMKKALDAALRDKGLQDEFKVVSSGCNGFCSEGPVMTVYPDGIFYEKLKPESVTEIVEEHFLNGKPVEKFMHKEPGKPKKVPLKNDILFFKQQVSLSLRNRGMIDPENIEEYIARDGYFAAAKALTEMSPEDLVKEVKESGIRGRGGAGFPTGLKWEACSMTPSDQKYMLCNGDEGDPGVVKDRSIMESDPHAVLEGMLIGARAINASQGYIYVRAEYALAVKRLRIAIGQAREYGLLGKDILGTGFDFDVEIFLGGGAFICGESTALMLSIEGKRGMPRPIPPNSAHKGLWGKPTVLNNVETLSNIPQIILNGGEWYRKLGTAESTGTKIFTLTGSVNNVGLVEVPMGTTLKDVIFEVGGGIKRGRKFKGVQVGGPSGCCIPEDLLDTPVTYEDIEKTGAMLGSGVMVVMDNFNCMVASDKFFLQFANEESCGKCPPCRVGTKVMLDMITDITEGRGKPGDIELLEDLSHEIMNVSLCGLGQTTPYPVLGTIRHYRDEYEAHIKDHYCKAGECTDLVTFLIDEESCKGCGVCLRACPSDAITGEKKKPHSINQELCIKCRSCFVACKFGSIKTAPARVREEILKNKEQPVGAET